MIRDQLDHPRDFCKVRGRLVGFVEIDLDRALVASDELIEEMKEVGIILIQVQTENQNKVYAVLA